jgi:glycosyltransferase involved in cell wall biosynthesis
MKVSILRAMNIHVSERMAEELGRRGHDVTLHYISWPHVRKPRESGAYATERMAAWEDWRSHSRPKADMAVASYFLKAINRFSRENTDVLVALQVFPCGVAGAMVKKFKDVPMVLMCRGYDDFFNRDQASRFVDAVRPTAFQAADIVVVQTEHMKRTLKETFGREGVVVPNAVDAEMFGGADGRAARRSLGIPEEEAVVAYVGSLEALKGVDVLVEAMTRFDEAPLLTIVGDGSERENLERQVSAAGLGDRVRFHGWVDLEAVPTHLAAADVLVLPTMSEGFPNVVLEAMAAGLPVVATNVLGIPEIVTDGENGILVPPRDPRALHEAMATLLADANLRERIGAANREVAAAHTWEALGDQLDACLNRATSREGVEN